MIVYRRVGKRVGGTIWLKVDETLGLLLGVKVTTPRGMRCVLWPGTREEMIISRDSTEEFVFRQPLPMRKDLTERTQERREKWKPPLDFRVNARWIVFDVPPEVKRGRTNDEIMAYWYGASRGLGRGSDRGPRHA